MAIDSVIFGFGYKQRSGKDTAVAEIIKQRGLTTIEAVLDKTVERYDIRRFAFADALKREVAEAAQAAGGLENLINSMRPQLPDWVQYEPGAEKPRLLLQWWGGDFRRSQDSEYWVRQLAQQIELEKPQFALISDLRYLNELRFCKEYGEVVKVERLGIPQGTHSSETELDSVSPEDWSIILENSGSLEEFLLGAVTAFDELLCNFPFGCNKK
jgi:hypothetical protein